MHPIRREDDTHATREEAFKELPEEHRVRHVGHLHLIEAQQRAARGDRVGHDHQRRGRALGCRRRTGYSAVLGAGQCAGLLLASASANLLSAVRSRPPVRILGHGHEQWVLRATIVGGDRSGDRRRLSTRVSELVNGQTLLRVNNRLGPREVELVQLPMNLDHQLVKVEPRYTSPIRTSE